MITTSSPLLNWMIAGELIITNVAIIVLVYPGQTELRAAISPLACLLLLKHKSHPLKVLAM